MFLKTYRVYLMGPLCLMFAGQPAKAQTDSLFLSVDQLFERGVQHSLQLQGMRSKKPWRKNGHGRHAHHHCPICKWD